MRNSTRTILLLAFFSGIFAATAEELRPFNLPWDDATPSVTDVSGLNEKPAGRSGFVTVANGHLAAGGKRFRIVGVNVCFGANFPTHEAADKIAARMAKFGINCVRFHHMDMFSAPGGIFAKDGRGLEPAQLDKLDYFIAQLKARGIYADLNLHVSRTYPDRPRSEKKGMPDYDKGVDNYCRAMIALQKDYARRLLTHVNAYTGVAYAEEPAVALVEINNENSLGFQWWAGQMDELPDVYRNELEDLWGAWLSKRHGTDDAIGAAWKAGARPPGVEMLSGKGGGWFFEAHGSAKADGEEKSGSITFEVSKPGEEAWHAQFSSGGLKVERGESYEVRFRVRAPRETAVSVTLMQAHEPWSVLANTSVKAGADWHEAVALLKAGASEDKARLTIGGMGLSTGKFEFSGFSLKVAGLDGGVVRDAGGRIGMIRKRELARSTAGKQRDWQEFLWDTETEYWNGMRDFLKGELGVKSLIVGTQGFWSPGHVQAGMDVIDSHAYWHHPDFHGRGWNADVWDVKNESMAGAANGGELPRLAAQRVQGKPFICTEYNHPAPNPHGAECFPLILGYAALQDWDGVFAFSYCHRGDAWAQDYFNNYFDIDRNTVKMATLPGAVLAWRKYAESDGAAAKGESVIRETGPAEMALAGGALMRAREPQYKVPVVFERRVGYEPRGGPEEDGDRKQPGGSAETTSFRWDTERKRVIIDTTHSKVWVGAMKPGERMDLSGVAIAVTGTRQNWGCLQVTVLEGEDFARARRILVTATGDTENSGMGWKSKEKTSVGRDWGRGPVLVEAIGATVELPGTGRIRAWALDERGERRDEIEVTGNKVETGGRSWSLWYEIERE